MVKGKSKELECQEDKINHIVKKQRDELMRPVTAFVTFNNQEAYEICLKYFETEYNWYGWPKFADAKDKEKATFKMLEVKCECKEAPEPSNIIWENLQDDNATMLKKKIFVYIFLLAFIILMIYVFILFRTFLA